MKKVFAVVIVFIALSSNSFSQIAFDENDVTAIKPADYKRNIVKVFPLDMLVSGFRVGYELYLNENLNFGIAAGYYYTEEASMYFNYDGFTGFNLMPELKYFLTRADKFNKLEYALFASAYGLYKEISLNYDLPNGIKTSNTSSAIGGGVMLGVQNMTKFGLFVENAVGGGIYSPLNPNNSRIGHLPVVNPYSGISLRYYLTLGFKF